MQIVEHIRNLARVEIYADPDRRINQESLRLPDNVEHIELLLAGEVFYQGENGTIQRFKRGTIFWHQGGEFDIWRNTSADSRYRCAGFTFNVKNSKRPVPEVGQWKQLEKLDDFVNEAMELFWSPERDLEMLGVWIYGTLLRQYMPAAVPTEEKMSNILCNALKHIHFVLPDAVSVAELANVASCSAMQLNRLFLQKFNLTPGEYITSERLKRSANLLCSNLSIQRVAEECGFKTLVGFYKAFRKFYNMTPGEYRRMIAARQGTHLQQQK